MWLCWVFVSARGLSPAAASGGHSSSRCVGLSLSRPLLLQSTGSRRAGSVIVAHGPSCSAARGILPDQGSNPCPLHWQADSQPLRHQGSPVPFTLNRESQEHTRWARCKQLGVTGAGNPRGLQPRVKASATPQLSSVGVMLQSAWMASSTSCFRRRIFTQ